MGGLGLGQSSFKGGCRNGFHQLRVVLGKAAAIAAIAVVPNAIMPNAAVGQTPGQTAPTVIRNPITVLSDIQESNSKAGTVTARGNVFVDYPARNLEATSAQAQYFSNERRLVLAGDVLVLQEGNSLRAEIVTYYVDEGRMVALPQPNRQVESIYLIPEGPAPTSSTAVPIDESLLNGSPQGPEQDPTGLTPSVAPVDATPATNNSEFAPGRGPFDF